MTPTAHVLPLPALRATPAPPLPALAPRSAPSLSSGVILALIVLALLLQASFFAGLSSGQPPAPQPAGVTRAAAIAR